jgi:transposase InsO family protein
MRAMLANQGIHLSALTVHRYMNKELGLKSVTRKPRYHYVKGPAPDEVFEDLLQQDFKAKRRNEKWCIDFTYVYFGKHTKRYNCTIIDLYDRRVVSSVCGRKINTQLAIDTLQKGLESVGGETGMILHSDRGSQFTSS